MKQADQVWLYQKEEKVFMSCCLQMLSALFLVLGMTMTYGKLLPEGEKPQMFMLMVTLAAVAVCTAASFSRFFEWCTPGIPAVAAVVVAILMGPQHCLRGLLGVLNGAIGWWNVKYEDGQALWAVEQITGEDILCFSLVAGLLFTAVFWELLRRKSAVLCMVLVLMLLLPGLILDRFSAPGCAGLLVGTAGVWSARTCPFGNYRRLFWLLVEAAALFGVAFVVQDGIAQEIRNWQEWSQEEIHRLRFGEDSLPEGDLYRADQMLDGEKERLLVKVTQQKTLYLRGFVGDSYEDGRWEPLSGTAFGGEQAGMDQWLEENGFYMPTQFDAYRLASEDPDKIENSVTVTNTGARRNYLYLTYGAEKPDERKMYRFRDSQYCSSAFLGCREYSFADYSQMLPGELLKVENWVVQPENEAQEKYIQSEAVYRTFVYQNYLETDQKLEPLMRELFWSEPMETEGIYAATDRIRTVLENRAAYEAHPDPVPEDMDPIRWFLQEGHQGNAALFASAAVQAYRIYGIPARYVEGYLVKDSRTGEASDEGIQLTTQDGHVWVEVYLDGMGWIPVDVTPGFYYDAYALQQLVERPQGTQRTAKISEDNDQADQVTDEEPGGLSRETSDPVWNRGRMAVGIGVLLLAAVIMTFIFLELCRLIRTMILGRRFQKMEEDEKTEFFCSQIIEQLHLMKISARMGDRPEITGTELLKLPGFYEGEYRRVNELMEKFIYSEEKLAPHEQRTLQMFLQKLSKAGRDLPVSLRLKSRYGVCFQKTG